MTLLPAVKDDSYKFGSIHIKEIVLLDEAELSADGK